MRLPLATDLKTRTGSPDKDARLKNAYVEIKGDQAVVRKRPIAQGGVSVGTGVAQGGLNGIVVYGDTLYSIPNGTTWNSGTSYVTGDHVSVGYMDFWAINDNISSVPPNANWSSSYVPAVYPASGWTIGTMPLRPYFSTGHAIAGNGSSVMAFMGRSLSGFDAPITSANGITWAQQADTSFTYAGTSVSAMVWMGSQFVIVGDEGTGNALWATSANGIAWTPQTSGVIWAGLYDIAWNGTRLCAPDIYSSGTVWISTDASTWTSHVVTGSPASALSRIVWNGSVFCVIATGAASTYAGTSADGITWTARTLPLSNTWKAIAAMGSTICCVSQNGNFATSTNNGATWTNGALPGAASTIAASNGRFIVTNGGASTATYYYSDDGVNWLSGTLPSASTWSVANYVNGKFIVTDNAGNCAVSATGL